MNRRITTLVGLGLAMALAACSGGSSSPGVGGSPVSASAAPVERMAAEPPGAEASTAGGGPVGCGTLLSAPEAETILGTVPTSTNEQAYAGGAFCRWNIGDGRGLTVSVSSDDGAVDLWRGKKDSVPTAADGQPTAPPDGLGDEAYAFDALADSYWVFVRRGDRTLYVSGPAASLPAQTVPDLVDELYGRF